MEIVMLQLNLIKMHRFHSYCHLIKHFDNLTDTLLLLLWPWCYLQSSRKVNSLQRNLFHNLPTQVQFCFYTHSPSNLLRPLLSIYFVAFQLKVNPFAWAKSMQQSDHHHFIIMLFCIILRVHLYLLLIF